MVAKSTDGYIKWGSYIHKTIYYVSIRRNENGQEGHEKRLNSLVIRKMQSKPQRDAPSNPPGWQLKNKEKISKCWQG